LLATKDGFVEVDAEGVYLMAAGAGTPGLPVITGVQAEASGPGQVIRGAGLGDALAVIAGLPTETVAKLSEVHVDGDGQIKVYTIEGIQCRFGLATEIQEKSAVFSQLLLELSKQGTKVRYIDLSSAGQPVVRYDKQ
jgi:cell division protein FtsQ